MKYTDLNCEACGVVFNEDDDVVVCPVCGAPHHRACWESADQCAHAASHPSGYVWTSPAKAQTPADKSTAENRPADSEKERMENGEAIIVCPSCGSRNYENDAFCLRCGKTLHPEAADPNQSRTYQRMEGENDYNASYNRPNISDEMLLSFRKYGGLHPQSTLDDIPVCEYSDYVGGGSPGKIIRKISTMERYGKKTSFLVPAFLFGPLWFMFRKMRKEGWVVGMVLILLSLFSGLLQINDAYVNYIKNTLSLYSEMLSGDMSQSDVLDKIADYAEDYNNATLSGGERFRSAASSAVYYLAIIGIPLYCGFFGLEHYRKKVKSDILRIRSECSDMNTYQIMLQKEGGTSAGGAIIGILIYLTAMLCYSYVPMLIALLYF